jgi:zinc transport system substrate-binding protein
LVALPLAGVLLAAMAAVCAAQGTRESAAAPLPVFVGIPPLAYLVERVGDGHVAVQVLVPPGRDPHTFQLTPRQMSSLSAAKLFFTVGMPLEKQLAERIASGPHGPAVVDASKGIKKRPMEADGDETDSAARRGAGDGGDPHVWLSPALLKTMAENVAAALEQVDPAHAADYRHNLERLRKDIAATDAAIAATLKPYRGRTFYVFHPAFGYFADAYGLRQVAIEAGGKAPTPKQLRELTGKARAEHAKIIFVQPQFDPRSAQAVAEAIGGTVVPIDDLATDVLENMQQIAAKIKRGFSD